MYPFEHVGPDGRTYMHNDNFQAWLHEKYEEYPHNSKHRRYLFKLDEPSSQVEPPHDLMNTVVHHLSVIFEVWPAHLHPHWERDPSLVFLCEDGHTDPFGELLAYYAGYSIIGSNAVTSIIRFRNQWWKISKLCGGHFGPNLPPKPPEPKKYTVRSIDDR